MIQLRDKDKSSFERLLDFLPDSIVATDADGRILFANEQAAQLFGYTQAELANQTVESLLPGKYENAHQNHRENYFAAPRTRSMGIGLELIGRKKDGTEFPVEISLSPAATKDGIMVLAAVRDHTLQKRAETEAAVRATQQAVVAELVMLALQDTDIAALLKTVAERVAQTLGVEFSAVLELQPDGTSFVLRAGMGWEQDSAGSVISASPDFMAGYTLLSRKLLTIADFSQEALTNVARHAQATRVAVSMKVSEGALLLTVGDNGRGVTDKELGRQDALGLLGMRERAESVGAQLTIEGVPGQGTTVRLRVPMAP
jgi:PAS domain S-box-containing protein